MQFQGVHVVSSAGTDVRTNFTPDCRLTLGQEASVGGDSGKHWCGRGCCPAGACSQAGCTGALPFFAEVLPLGWHVEHLYVCPTKESVEGLWRGMSMFVLDQIMSYTQQWISVKASSQAGLPFFVWWSSWSTFL